MSEAALGIFEPEVRKLVQQVTQYKVHPKSSGLLRFSAVTDSFSICHLQYAAQTNSSKQGEQVGSKIQLMLNGEQSKHADALRASIGPARHLDCMVAFAKGSALDLMLEPLKNSLGRGMTARFAIGLSFHLTEPALLRKLFSLSKRFPLELYLSDTEATFHPKIYAFTYADRSTVFVGSANLTAGGLSNNYEASARIDGADGALAAEVAAHLDELIE